MKPWRLSRLLFFISCVAIFTLPLEKSLSAQHAYDLLIRNGHLVDPRNEIDGEMDVAVRDGRIAQVSRNIQTEEARQVIDATGLIVAPGLIDIHVHAFYGTEPHSDYSDGFLALPPDGFTLRSGVTTAVDTGGSGWRNFRRFKENVIDRSRTRILAMLNIVGAGMKGDPTEQDLNDMDSKLTAMMARQFPGLIVGIKVAHYRGPEWDPVQRAVEAGRLADLPVMVDFGRHIPPLSLQELFLERLRPGDIFTHTYAEIPERETILGPDGKVLSFAFEAQQRGVAFDVGHGGGSFVFRQMIPAMEQRFWPDSISTDLHANSMNAGMKDMLNVVSKFLNQGMPVQEAVARSTWNPARLIQRPDLGHLSVGAVADIAVLRLREGDFGFLDVENIRMKGALKLECELTLREGAVVWDLNGLAGEGF